MFMGSPALSCHASDCATWAHGLSVAIVVVCAINQLHQHMHVLLRATRQHTGQHTIQLFLTVPAVPR